MSKAALEEREAEIVFERAESLECIAATLPETDDRRQELIAIASALVADAGPMRPRIAASLLGLNEKTVRHWALQGVLLTVEEEPRLLLDPVRVHLVKHAVIELREAGRTRGLLEEVFRRFVDDALHDSDELQRSLDEMRRGEGTVVRPNPRSRA